MVGPCIERHPLSIYERLRIGGPDRADIQDNQHKTSSLQAPVKTRTAVGKMLDYYLRMEPHLFEAAIDKQLEELQQEKDRKDQQAKEAAQAGDSKDKNDMVLYRHASIYQYPSDRSALLSCTELETEAMREERQCHQPKGGSSKCLAVMTSMCSYHGAILRRINEAQRGEQRATLEDIMYICVLEKFVKLGVPMMPRLEVVADTQTGNFKKLTEVGIAPCCRIKYHDIVTPSTALKLSTIGLPQNGLYLGNIVN